MPHKILVIESDRNVSRMVEQVLGESRHTVITACNGLDGLRKHGWFEPDLVITELLMSDTDGIEVISEIKRFDGDAKVVAVTAGGCMSREKLLEIAQKLGASGALAKPFNADELLAVVATCLEH